VDTNSAWLAGLTVIVIAGCLARFAARRTFQTAVVGEIVIGILIAQALVFLVPRGGDLLETPFPALRTLADLGITLFMFEMGLHAHRLGQAGKSRVRWTVPLGSFFVPFLVGCGLATLIQPEHSGGSRSAFVLFIGTAFAATAFPVLARILEEKGMHRSALGAVAVHAAAVCDILCWSIMAIVIAWSRSETDHRTWLAAVYVAAMLLVVRPLLRRWLSKGGGTADGIRLPILLTGLLTSTFLSDLLGLHVIVGAFLFGAIIPAGAAGESIRRFMEGAAPLCAYLLLPTYFVLAGLRLDLTGLGAGDWLLFVVVVGAAVAGKLLGTYSGARLGGLQYRSSVRLAVLMNTRGLTEIVILTIGLEAGIIDQRIYTVMVLMALVTTAMTTPLLGILARRWDRASRPSPDTRDLISA
jgi:Kef-type K+ transport system membrane component KefB